MRHLIIITWLALTTIAVAQPFPPATTPYTRSLLKETAAAGVLTNLGIVTTNMALDPVIITNLVEGATNYAKYNVGTVITNRVADVTNHVAGNRTNSYVSFREEGAPGGELALTVYGSASAKIYGDPLVEWYGGADRVAYMGGDGTLVANAVSVNEVYGNLPNFIDVTRAPYSADPTGVNSSTTNIQAAINAAAVAGARAVVYFPPGKYILTNRITIPSSSGSGYDSDGPIKLLGNGFTKSRLKWTPQNTNGFDFSMGGPIMFGLTIEGLGIIGPLITAWNETNDAIGVVGGSPGCAYSTSGHQFTIKDCEISGWDRAVSLTNVWQVVIDRCLIASNRVYGLLFSGTHSVDVRDTYITSEGNVLNVGPERRLGHGIAFRHPPSPCLGWGDTAFIQNTRIDFCTNAIYNDEVNLTDISGNYQANYLVYDCPGSLFEGGIHSPYLTLMGTMFCDKLHYPGTVIEDDSAITNNTYYAAEMRFDSISASKVTLLNFVGAVCGVDSRAQFQVVKNMDGAGGALTNYIQPNVVGSANFTGIWQATNTVTAYAINYGMVTNNAGTGTGSTNITDGTYQITVKSNLNVWGDVNATGTVSAVTMTVAALNAGTLSGITNSSFGTNLQTYGAVPDMNVPYSRTNISGDLTYTSLTGVESNTVKSIAIFIDPSAAACQITVPEFWYSADQTNSWALARGATKRGVLSITTYGDKFTNVAFKSFIIYSH